MSQSGSISSIGGGGGSSDILLFKSPVINLLQTGETIIFIPSGDFIILHIIAVPISIIGVFGFPEISIGFTSPNYNEYFSQNNGVASQFQYFFSPKQIIRTINAYILPSSNPLILKVTTADSSATTNNQRFDVVGYYV